MEKSGNKLMIYLLLIILAISIGINIYFLIKNKLVYTNKQANSYTAQVTKVIDGDTFDIGNGERIRLFLIDAPEYPTGCNSLAAKERLEQLVLNKNIKIEAMKKDNFGRMLAFVFLEKLLINKALVSEGLAQFSPDSKQTVYSLELNQAQEEAMTAQRGIWSSICQNRPRPDCLIKGNFRADKNTKIYHLPNCFNYDKITVNLRAGDRWFCSEEEATRAGFIKSKDCP